MIGQKLRDWVSVFLRGKELRDAKRLKGKLLRLRKQANGLFREVDGLFRRLDKCRDGIQKLREEMEAMKYEETIEALQARIDLLENVTVPGLVTSHQLLVKEMETRIALETHRQAVLSGATGANGEVS